MAESPASIDLSRLKPGARIRLPGRSDVVQLIAATPGPFWDLVFEGPGGLGKVTLAEGELGRVRVEEESTHVPLDADPERFRLGIEARRIQTAFTWDMAAAAVSNIQPLPHQLEAVYGDFMREPRLRFLLADDPGAGKTIMAGLYMKELELRRAGDCILVVTPASHSWINRNRALLIRWSKQDDNHLALLMLACGLIAFKKARAATHAAALPG